MKRVELYFGEQTVGLEAAVFRPDGLSAACCHFFLFVSDQKLSFTSSSTNKMALLLYSSVLICSVILVLEYSVE